VNVRSAILWTLAAVAGLLLAAGVTLAASSLSSQRVGLSAEPLTAGDSLAPTPAGAEPTATATPERKKATRRKKRRPARTATPTPVRTAVPTAVPTVGSGDDGGGHGRGRGRGGDDDGGGGDD
jgi:septal ring-binding cell division protein DamX